MKQITENRVAFGLGWLVGTFGQGTLKRLRASLNPASRYCPLDVRSSLRCPLAVAGQASYQELITRHQMQRHDRVSFGFEPSALSPEDWDELQAAWVKILSQPRIGLEG